MSRIEIISATNTTNTTNTPTTTTPVRSSNPLRGGGTPTMKPSQGGGTPTEPHHNPSQGGGTPTTSNPSQGGGTPTEPHHNPSQGGGTPNIKTFRFEFSRDFIDELSRFSKVHQYDERRAYKEAWQKWKSNEEIDRLISFEIRRLEDLGYKGDIEDKMFKSGRYYFRKKLLKETTNNNNIGNNNCEEEEHDDDDDLKEENTRAATTTTATTAATTNEKAKKETTQRRPYITMSKSCIRMMDRHIEECSKKTDFKPSTSYDSFYHEKMTTAPMMEEIENIVGKYEKTLENNAVATKMMTKAKISNNSDMLEVIMQDIMDKIKKTFKNRYYRFVNAENK
jgi:hypothetical protein